MKHTCLVAQDIINLAIQCDSLLFNKKAKVQYNKWEIIEFICIVTLYKKHYSIVYLVCMCVFIKHFLTDSCWETLFYLWQTTSKSWRKRLPHTRHCKWLPWIPVLLIETRYKGIQWLFLHSQITTSSQKALLIWDCAVSTWAVKGLILIQSMLGC